MSSFGKLCNYGPFNMTSFGKPYNYGCFNITSFGNHATMDLSIEIRLFKGIGD
jgi:hypothetical protein